LENKLVVFKNKKIRRILHNNEWYFAVVDVVAALTNSDKPRDYWYRMKKRELESAGFELSSLCRQLKLESIDGEKYQTEMADLTDEWQNRGAKTNPRRGNGTRGPAFC
jgi:prophage antirepressor-like protein